MNKKVQTKQATVYDGYELPFDILLAAYDKLYFGKKGNGVKFTDSPIFRSAQDFGASFTLGKIAEKAKNADYDLRSSSFDIGRYDRAYEELLDIIGHAVVTISYLASQKAEYEAQNAKLMASIKRVNDRQESSSESHTDPTSVSVPKPVPVSEPVSDPSVVKSETTVPKKTTVAVAESTGGCGEGGCAVHFGSDARTAESTGGCGEDG